MMIPPPPVPLAKKVIAEYVGTFILIFAGGSHINCRSEDRRLRDTSRPCLCDMPRCHGSHPIHWPHLEGSSESIHHDCICSTETLSMSSSQDLASFSAAFVLKGVFHPIIGGGVTVPAPGYNYAQAFALEFVITFIPMFVVTVVATDTKAGLEDPQEQIHKIRITLSSKHIKNLEKGMLPCEEGMLPCEEGEAICQHNYI